MRTVRIDQSEADVEYIVTLNGDTHYVTSRVVGVGGLLVGYSYLQEGRRVLVPLSGIQYIVFSNEATLSARVEAV